MLDSVFVVINPAAGQPEPVLSVLCDLFAEQGVTWDVGVTQPDRSAADVIADVVPGTFDAIAAYGGDGTIGAAATALIDRPEALGVLPGGTGNVVAQALGIPTDLKQAVISLTTARPREIDALRTPEGLSLLRIGYGADAATIGKASREHKDSLGWLAYLRAATESAWTEPQRRYRFELDGEEHDVEAVALSVCNIGQLSRAGAMIHPEIRFDDGKLDVVIAETAYAPFVDIAARNIPLPGADESHQQEEQESSTRLRHFQGRAFRWLETPDSACHVDGDPHDRIFDSIRCEPGAVKVLALDDQQIDRRVGS